MYISQIWKWRLSETRSIGHRTGQTWCENANTYNICELYTTGMYIRINIEHVQTVESDFPHESWK